MNKYSFLTFTLILLCWLLLGRPIVSAQQQRLTITVQLQDDKYNAAIVGTAVHFQDESGQLSADCITDTQGQCQLVLGNLTTSDTVRGVLELGISGVRSLIFRVQDGDFTVVLQVDQFGQLLIPGHHEHATLPALASGTATALPPARPQMTVTMRPTTQFIIGESTRVTPISVGAQKDSTQFNADGAEGAEDAEGGMASAETTASARWLLSLLGGLWVATGIALLIWFRRRNRQTEEHFYV